MATIDELPHWARVAYAARCARRVVSLLERHWPKIPGANRESIDTAIELAERAAAFGRAVEGLRTAKMNATIAAGVALIGRSGRAGVDPAKAPNDERSELIASFVAKAAEKATAAAIADSGDSSNESAIAALSFAADAARTADAGDILDELENDLVLLCRVSKRGAWMDRTPVPANIWSLFE